MRPSHPAATVLPSHAASPSAGGVSVRSRLAPVWASVPLASALLVSAAALLLSGCAVVTVADAAASVAATAVSTAATVVGTTVDVAASGVRAVVGSGSAKK